MRHHARTQRRATSPRGGRGRLVATALLALGRVLPEGVVDYGTLLLTAGLCGIAIAANERDSRLLPR